MHVLANVVTPLLSRLAGTQLDIVAKLDTVSELKQALIDQYPKLFKSLGCLSGGFHIKLKPNAQSYAVYEHSRIYLPLMPKVKDEIYQLLSLGVNERVDESTEWCAPIFVAP